MLALRGLAPLRAVPPSVRGSLELRGLALEADPGLLVAAVQLVDEVAPQAERPQRVSHRAGVRPLMGGRAAHLLDEGVEACAQVVGVGGLAREREQGLAEAPFQGSPPLAVSSRRVASAGS